MCFTCFGLEEAKTNLLNQPESVAFDLQSNRYLVSNWADGKIIAIDSLGEHTVFNEDLSSVAGIKIFNNKLYCCERNGLAIIDLTSGDLDTLIYVEDSALLNDLEFLGEYLFISDYWDPKIYRMNLNDYTFEVLVQQSNFVPNGLCLDAENNRILSVVRNENGYEPRVMAINPETGDLELVINTPFYSLDGITRDSAGNWYLSSWYVSPGVQGIFRYPSDFSGSPVLITNECDGPADILVKDQNLLIPNLNSNTLQIISLAGGNNTEDTISLSENYIKICNYPNPFNPETTIEFDLPAKEKINISVFNSKGQKINTLYQGEMEKGKHKILFNAQNKSDKNCASGIYFIRVESSKNSFFHKIVLIK